MVAHKILTRLLVLVVLVATACSPKAVSVEKQAAKEGAVQATVAAPQAAPKATAAPAATTGGAGGPGAAVAKAEATPATGPGVVAGSAYQAGRMIVKDGQMTLVVADTDRAIEDVTRIAVTSGGYIISADTTLTAGYRSATLSLGVPVDQFEAVQSKVRALALRVTKDTASGEDVSDQYVDMQSRVANLEATAARIRTFLDQAKTVEEALKVNAQLSEIESQIEQVKGRMNYLKDRATYSTLQVKLEPDRPTPTPTSTATVTPTPTPTATPTLIAWRPGQTFQVASTTLLNILRVAGDLAIWLITLFGPFIILLVVVVLLIRRWRPAPKVAPAPPAAPVPPAPPQEKPEG